MIFRHRLYLTPLSGGRDRSPDPLPTKTTFDQMVKAAGSELRIADWITATDDEF